MNVQKGGKYCADEVSLSHTLEFSLNEFHLIHRITTKFKNSIVTKSITYLATDTLPVIATESASLGRCHEPLCHNKNENEFIENDFGKTQLLVCHLHSRHPQISIWHFQYFH